MARPATIVRPAAAANPQPHPAPAVPHLRKLRDPVADVLALLVVVVGLFDNVEPVEAAARQPGSCNPVAPIGRRLIVDEQGLEVVGACGEGRGASRRGSASRSGPAGIQRAGRVVPRVTCVYRKVVAVKGGSRMCLRPRRTTRATPACRAAHLAASPSRGRAPGTRPRSACHGWT